MTKLTRKSLSNSPKVLAALGVFYILLVFAFAGLYVQFYSKAGANPGFALTHKVDRDSKTLAMLALTIILLIIYYVWYALAFIHNVRSIWSQDRTARTMFVFSNIAHALVFVCFVLGANS